jgi:mycothiol synthase
VSALPGGWVIRRPDLGEVTETLAMVHASDIAAVGEPDFTSDEIVEIFSGLDMHPAYVSDVYERTIQAAA